MMSSVFRVSALVALLALAGCDQKEAQRGSIEAADQKAKLGAWREAIRGYEGSLDGTAKTADLHYKIAVLYDDKLKSPLDAVHHYDRYLDLQPNGSRAKEAKAAKTDCEKRLQTQMHTEGFMPTSEAARLRNENESLRKIIAELRNPKPTPPPGKPDPSKPDVLPPGSKLHMVSKGETLASISIKYYKTRVYAGHIKDANFNQLGGKDTIHIGQRLIIPEMPGNKKKK